MRFNIFFIFMFVVCYLNLSVDLIQQDRFKRERELVLANRATSHHHQPGGRPLAGGKKGEKKISFIQRVRYLLEYNEMSFIHCAFVIVQVVIIIWMLWLSAIYAFLPHTRDPVTLKYKQPILKFAESIYMFDWMEFYKRTRYYNYSLVVMYLQYLSIKLVNIKRIYDTCQANRHHYKRINVIQLDYGCMDNMRMYAKDWFELLFHQRRHKCQVESHLYKNENEDKLRKLFYQVKKLDRLYYFNMLSFDDCYRDLNMVRERREKNYPSYREISWFRWLFSTRLPGFRFHKTTPLQRAERSDLALLAILNISGLIFIAVTYLFSVFRLSWVILKYNSVDFSNGWQKVACEILQTPKLAMSILLAIASFSLTTLNVADNGLLLLSSIFWASRAKKIKRMLNYETHTCRWHLLEFAEYLRLKRAHVDENVQSNLETQFDGFSTPVWQQTFIPYKLDDIWRTKQSDPSRGAYEELVDQYKTDRVDVKQVKRLNENLVYLVDLISHLKCEQEDIKTFFTYRLNINIIAGATGATLALSEWIKAQTSDEKIIVFLFVIVVMLPMFIALFLGATSEAAFRKILRHLEPLLANDLRLVEIKVLRKLQRTYVYLTCPQNRGFILLGNLTLNFGSLVTIFGTIGSVFILREKH